MNVSHAVKDLRVVVELVEDEVKGLRSEYEKLDSYKFPTIDNLMDLILDLAPEN